MRAWLTVVFALLVAQAVLVVDVAPASALACTPRESCCKVCQKGQACGNSCISRDKSCHQPPGCACDSVDVCE